MSYSAQDRNSPIVPVINMNEHADSLPVTEPTGIVGGLVNTPFLSIRASVCHRSTGLVDHPLLKLG